METTVDEEKHRPVLGWLVGIAVFAVLVIGFDRAGEALGAHSRIELDESITVTRGYGVSSQDEEVDAVTTWYGQMTTFLSLVWAIWAGFAAASRRMDAGWDRKGWITFRAWVTGLSILSLLALGSDLAAGDSGRGLQIARNALGLGLTAVVATFCYRWWSMRTESLKAKPE